MRRIAVTCAALVALSGAVAARAADTPSTGSVLPAAKLASCDTGGSDRSALFYGRMDALPGATRMAMRFIVLEKLGRGASWTKVDLPSLRQWHRAAPGVKTFGYKQTVDNLRSGGAYKARIQFRWSTAAGVNIESQARDTPVCRGGLPNLTVSDLAVRSGPTDDTRTYRVTVENDGRADADDVRVVLSVDRGILDTQTLDELDNGDSRTLSFVGPVCTKGMRVRVDPDNTIGELDEDDNSQLFSCP